MTHIVLTAVMLAARVLSAAAQPTPQPKVGFLFVHKTAGGRRSLESPVFQPYRGTMTREKAARVFP